MILDRCQDALTKLNDKKYFYVNRLCKYFTTLKYIFSKQIMKTKYIFGHDCNLYILI